MLDNASNNDTLVSSLAAQLVAQGIEFSAHEQRIRYLHLLSLCAHTNYYNDRCFLHIINLAVQAVLNSITNMSYAREDGEQFNMWQ